MDIHKNARLTLRRREDLVEYVSRGVTLKLAAANFSVTPKTAAKWVHRFRREGPPGLWDRSSRPRRSPRRTSSTLTEEVIALRRQLHPAYRIAQATQLSAATVSRILQRAHLNRWRHLHPAPPVVRYEHAAPGDLLHLDIKAMTRYQSVSIRGDGRRRGRPQFAGWQALHIAIDDHSRLAFSRLLPNQTVDSALAFLRAALAFYAEHGIAIRRLLTDNGSCYRSHRFRAACEELGIRHRFTRPYTPRTNGKAERFIQTALREWAYVRHYTNSEERDQQLSPWLHYYNFARPHGSLGYAPPISRAVPKGTTS
jgi:transposase InsO family protein